MYQYFPSNNQPFTAWLAIENKMPYGQNFNVYAKDLNRDFTEYTRRIVTVGGFAGNPEAFIKAGKTPPNIRIIKLMFPKAPVHMGIFVGSQTTGINEKLQDPSFTSYTAKIVKDVARCDIWMDAQTEKFLSFAEEFAENAGILSPGIYRSNDGEFTIKYQPYLLTKEGLLSNTPSRVGWITGNIDVSQRHFINYSIPQRLLIELHEYVHKYNNPKLQRQIDDEGAADMQALYLYLGRGYPRIDAYEVFLNIFYTAQTPENRQRLQKITEFIKRFEAKNSKVKCEKI